MRTVDPDRIYMTTTNTYDWICYFENPVLCKSLIDDMKISKQIYGFDLFGFVINFDHLHFLLRSKTYNSSKILHSIKTNASRNINKILGYSKNILPEIPQSRGQNKMHLDSLRRYERIDKYIKEYQSMKCNLNYPKFHWNKSFHDEFVKIEGDFSVKLNYIHKNPAKHGITSDWQNYRWSSMNPEYMNLIDNYLNK